MKRHLSRRDFVKASVLGSAALPLALRAQPAADPEPKPPAPDGSEVKGLPKGRIGNLEVTRLILGGNLIAG
ncbi:MAG TPA: twin-arginine translocation signal domain-containing protein, partial [Candidatus Sulfotelmatobacter sp.]|nr:twin-arginine translocation signal domain-containing protein [Candidatus Sulfotelmatobacter sp.]